MQEHFGITSIYVTHDQEEALVMSDKIAVMNAGQLEHVGTPRELYAESGTEFVCTFLGDANQLNTPAILEQIGMASRGIKSSDMSYLRIEKMHVVRPGYVEKDEHISFDGVVRKSNYQGTVTNYIIDSPIHGEIKAIVKEDERNFFTPGEAVTLAFNPRHLLFYDGTTGKRILPN